MKIVKLSAENIKARHPMARRCDVLAALDARRLARQFRRQGRHAHAAVAWGLVQTHLHLSRIAKVSGSAA